MNDLMMLEPAADEGAISFARGFVKSDAFMALFREGMGLVERRRDPADERQVRVNVTPAGRKLQRQVASSAVTLIEATGLGDDFATVQQTVAKLRDNLLLTPSTGAK